MYFEVNTGSTSTLEDSPIYTTTASKCPDLTGIYGISFGCHLSWSSSLSSHWPEPFTGPRTGTGEGWHVKKELQ
jgi:hypothetical protein